MEIQYRHQLTMEEYNALRASAGLSTRTRRQFDCCINRSVYLITAVEQEKTVGMARIVGDGGYNALIVDVIVLPEYQHRGIATEMMRQLLQFIEDSMEEGETTMVDLMAVEGKESFYHQFGFFTRPAEGQGAGMSVWLRK